MFFYKRELLTENNFNRSLLLLLFIPLLLARTNPRFCRWVVVVLYVVVFSLRNPPPNRPLSSCPLNRLLPKFKNVEHSPPVDDDFDAIGNNIALRSLRLLRLKAAAWPPEEKKALKLLLLLHARDEQKVALIILLINTLLLCTHSFSVVIRSRTREKKVRSAQKLGLDTLNIKLQTFSSFMKEKTLHFCAGFLALFTELLSGVV